MAITQPVVLRLTPPVVPLRTCTLTAALRDLDQVAGTERFTLMRVGPLDWECRTLTGSVGRGSDPVQAVQECAADVIRERAALRAVAS